MVWFRNMGSLKNEAALDWLVRNVPSSACDLLVCRDDLGHGT